MFWDVEVTPKDEEDIIRKTAETLHKIGMDEITLTLLSVYQPLAYIGGQMSRFLISPFLLFLGENTGRSGEKIFTIFEKRENVKKLIVLMEKMAKEKELKVKQEKLEKKQEKDAKETSTKRSWRRFLPF